MGSSELRSAAMGTGLCSPEAFLESTATTCSSSLASAPRQICRAEHRTRGRELPARAPAGPWAGLGSHRSQQHQVLQEVIVLLQHAAPGARAQLAAWETRRGLCTHQLPPPKSKRKVLPPPQNTRAAFPGAHSVRKGEALPAWLPAERSHHPQPTPTTRSRPGAHSSVPHSAATGRSSDSNREKSNELFILHSKSNTRDSSTHRATSPCPHTDC